MGPHHGRPTWSLGAQTVTAARRGHRGGVFAPEYIDPPFRIRRRPVGKDGRFERAAADVRSGAERGYRGVEAPRDGVRAITRVTVLLYLPALVPRRTGHRPHHFGNLGHVPAEWAVTIGRTTHSCAHALAPGAPGRPSSGQLQPTRPPSATIPRNRAHDHVEGASPRILIRQRRLAGAWVMGYRAGTTH